jgi:hypothetical protein
VPSERITGSTRSATPSNRKSDRKLNHRDGSYTGLRHLARRDRQLHRGFGVEHIQVALSAIVIVAATVGQTYLPNLSIPVMSVATSS